MKRIVNGEAFPTLHGLDLDDNAVDLGALAADSWAAVLIYRGHW